MDGGDDNTITQQTQSDSFRPRCLAFDLEIGKKDGRIHQLGAVRGDSGESLAFSRGDLNPALDKLDALAVDAAFVLGHNILAFDLPHLQALRPGLGLLQKPAVDTLYLNPLAFPRNPYHHLVKHYKDGPLQAGHRNDPLKDAQLALEVFRDQNQALAALNAAAPQLVAAWHWLTTQDDTVSGLNSFFMRLRRQARPAASEALAAIRACLAGQCCITQQELVLAQAHADGWPLAYALAWLSVAGGNSVMPPWVRHQFPAAGELIRRLRDTACTDPGCAWCREHHDAQRALQRWFGFDAFRPEPADAATGRPLQQLIVESAMAGRHVLGILPTGTGKSVCYQVPALSRFYNTGSLTVVISPLVALMADQVAGLLNKNITCCAALNGLLSPPERSDVLDRVRLGDIGILIVSPEQLRNKAFRKVLEQREIGAWVLDEAHCLSKWGHDFRPDYRYVGRFIKEKAGTGPIPPILCLTATAKPDVVDDILAHFRDKLGIEMLCLDGGARRENLEFAVAPTSPQTKFAHIHQIIATDLPPDMPGGAIVYCATRKQTEEVAAFLSQKGLAAGYFHAKLSAERKKHVQESFIKGDLRVIAATNAFGMGIDKPDVRLVIHADIPGSLENYLQEAGRAGRDQEAARCVLLYTPEDVERQFGMSARSRLTQKEIQAILKSLRTLVTKKQREGKTDSEVNATAGEILAVEEDKDFQRDSTTDDTRVRTAIAWLEEALLVSREENQVQVFPSSLRVGSVAAADAKLATVAQPYRKQLLTIVDALIAADADEGITTDELTGLCGLGAGKLRAAFADLERLGIASNDTALTAFLQVGVKRPSQERLEAATRLELALIDELRRNAPDLSKGDSSVLHLRIASQHLKDAGHATALPENLRRLLKCLASDGRDDDNNSGSLALSRIDGESVKITLNREWSKLEKTARLRQNAAQTLFRHLLSCLPAGARGADLLAETTLGNLLAALNADLLLMTEIRDPQKLIDHALLWLHELEIIRLNKGLAVFRPAMTIRIDGDWKKKFGGGDFAPLKLHYDEQRIQIHVMAEYVQRGLAAMADALRLAMDYFSLRQDDFLQRWLPGRENELALQTTPESWARIVESLHNKAQRDIVADDREQSNVLVLAGPGSGKTRVLVHRIAYLVRVRRENPHGIIALAYNRHAAAQIRQRLSDLIGDDARGVLVLTLHALAMRLTGASFAERAQRGEGGEGDDYFKQVLEDAIALLKGDDPVLADDADAQRDRLLAGFRWILVDEYQDIDAAQYELLSALAGRTRSDEDDRINLFAVGDDDQNIYGFNGASVDFIRRFEADYKAKPAYLIENYRSTAHIIAAANALIAPARERMKAAHPIRIDKVRAKLPPGGEWRRLDNVGQGRVQILPAGIDRFTQAMAVMAELERLAARDPAWQWSRCAVIARQWAWLEPLRSYCVGQGIPVQMANEGNSNFWRLRETQALLDWLAQRGSKLVSGTEIKHWLNETASQETAHPHWAMLLEAIDDYLLETCPGTEDDAASELPTDHFKDWLAEWGREARRRQTGLMLTSAHGAKGLEFDHVVVLDGGWTPDDKEDADAVRRLFYVAATRARKTLALARLAGQRHLILDTLPESDTILRRAPTQLPPAPEALRLRHASARLGEVNIGFAGHQAPDAPIHGALARLRPGSPLNLRHIQGVWQLLNVDGVTVGKMAKAYSPPAGFHCVSTQVGAILRWNKDIDDGKYREPRCERWEVVIPAFTYAPD